MYFILGGIIVIMIIIGALSGNEGCGCLLFLLIASVIIGALWRFGILGWIFNIIGWILKQILKLFARFYEEGEEALALVVQLL